MFPEREKYGILRDNIMAVRMDEFSWGNRSDI